MSEQSAKPYLVRAIYEWCIDQGYTPYLAVRVNSLTRVPQAFVKNGEIVLNISATATRQLKIDNEWIQFSARFNGVSHEVSVPIAAVAGIFARETGYGFAFNVQPDASALQPVAPPGQSIGAAAAQNGANSADRAGAPEAADRDPDAPSDPGGPRRPRRPKLQVVK